MQDAYFQEKNNVGDWTQIGYSAPGTGNSFSYESTVFKYSTTASTVEATTADWMAAPKSDLNDCPANSVGWKLTATKSDTDDKVRLSRLFLARFHQIAINEKRPRVPMVQGTSGVFRVIPI